MGCGFGGGIWEIVSQIIEETLPEAIIVKFEKERNDNATLRNITNKR